MKLHVVDGGQVVHALEVPESPVTVGRAPGNTLTLRRAVVSSHHALLTRQPGGMRFRDLGSTNGLLLNGVAVVEGLLGPDDVLRVGDVDLHLELETDDAPTGLHVEQLDGPVSWALESGLSLPGHEGAVLSLDAEGLWLDDGRELTPLAVGTPFQVQGRRYRVVERPLLTATVPVVDHLPYRIETDLTAGRAVLSGASLASVTVTSPNRVSLLYVLTEEVPEWVDDATIGTAVWGRSWTRNDPNNLNVLLHRLRAQAAKAGYDKRFIERRRGEMRLRVKWASNG